MITDSYIPGPECQSLSVLIHYNPMVKPRKPRNIFFMNPRNIFLMNRPWTFCSEFVVFSDQSKIVVKMKFSKIGNFGKRVARSGKNQVKSCKHTLQNSKKTDSRTGNLVN